MKKKMEGEGTERVVGQDPVVGSRFENCPKRPHNPEGDRRHVLAPGTQRCRWCGKLIRL